MGINLLNIVYKKLREHEDRLNKHDSLLSDHAKALSQLQSQPKASSAKSSHREPAPVIVKEITKEGDGGVNTDDLMDRLEIMIENLRKECYGTFVSQRHIE